MFNKVSKKKKSLHMSACQRPWLFLYYYGLWLQLELFKARESLESFNTQTITFPAPMSEKERKGKYSDTKNLEMKGL